MIEDRGFAQYRPRLLDPKEAERRAALVVERINELTKRCLDDDTGETIRQLQITFEVRRDECLVGGGSVKSRKIVVMRAVAEKVIPPDWEWRLIECIDGDCFVEIIRVS